MSIIRNAVDGMLVERDAQGRVWNQLFPRGKWHREDYPGGAITYDDAFFQRLIDNWKASGSRPVPIDYYHRGHSVDGDGNSIDDKVAAGFMHDFEVRPAGMFALCEWTERGGGYVKAGELRYISPTFQLDWLNPTTGKRAGPRLLAAGLLNDPFFTTLPKLAARDMPRVAASATPPPPTPKEPNMEKKLLCAALGIAEDTADESLMQTLQKCGAWLKTPADEETKKQAALQGALTSQAKDFEALKQAHAALAAKNTELIAAVDKLASEKRAADVEAVVEAHKAHFVPAQRDVARKLVQTAGLEDGAKMLASWPVVAPPMGVFGHGQPGDGAGEDKVANTKRLEEIARDIQKNEGVSGSVAFELASRRNPNIANKAV